MGGNLSTFIDRSSCLEALNNALEQYGIPEIINSDQGCQFTSALWIETLVQHKISISMDGKGRWADNVYVERLWRTIK
jgi:putative transposase